MCTNSLRWLTQSRASWCSRHDRRWPCSRSPSPVCRGSFQNCARARGPGWLRLPEGFLNGPVTNGQESDAYVKPVTRYYQDFSITWWKTTEIKSCTKCLMHIEIKVRTKETWALSCCCSKVETEGTDCGLSPSFGSAHENRARCAAPSSHMKTWKKTSKSRRKTWTEGTARKSGTGCRCTPMRCGDWVEEGKMAKITCKVCKTWRREELG